MARDAPGMEGWDERVNGDMSIEVALGLAGVPIVVALTEAVKVVVPGLAPRWYPLVALGWALLLNVGVGAHRGGDPVVGAVGGLIVALAAIGLYSGGRTLAS
jgi:hypothetical protein